MYQFIFEDNGNTPSSKLLKESYNGDNIHFSFSNRYLVNKVDELISKGFKDIIVFVDVVPNNDNTISLYKSLSDEKYGNEEWGNVIIVPIICIEYFLAKLCLDNGYFGDGYKDRLAVKYLVNDFCWDKIPEKYKSISLEKLYKRLFIDNKVNKECLINISSYGRFYKDDCNCCELSTDTLSKKAELLYTSLPIFDVIDSMHENIIKKLSISTEEADIAKFSEIHNKFYNYICKTMGIKANITVLY